MKGFPSHPPLLFLFPAQSRRHMFGPQEITAKQVVAVLSPKWERCRQESDAPQSVCWRRFQQVWRLAWWAGRSIVQGLLSFPWLFPSVPLACQCPLGEGFVLWHMLNIVKGGVHCTLKKGLTTMQYHFVHQTQPWALIVSPDTQTCTAMYFVKQAALLSRRSGF